MILDIMLLCCAVKRGNFSKRGKCIVFWTAYALTVTGIRKFKKYLYGTSYALLIGNAHMGTLFKNKANAIR